VELAIALPMLMLFMFGAGDFGRIFYAAVSVTNAAETGALYGSYSVGRAQDTTGISTAVTNDTQDLSGVTVASTTFCQCPDQSSISCDASVSCPTGGLGLGTAPKKRLYSKVTATYTFNQVPVVNYPGLPTSVTINKQVIMRVQ
jgi:Flp pilus assembly protein TadG